MKNQSKLILKGIADDGIPFKKEIHTLDEVKSSGSYVVICKNANSDNGLPSITGKSRSCFCCEAQLNVTCCYSEDEAQSNTAYGQTLTICDRETGATNTYTRTISPGKNNDRWSEWKMVAIGNIELVSQNSSVYEAINNLSNNLNAETTRATITESALKNAMNYTVFSRYSSKVYSYTPIGLRLEKSGDYAEIRMKYNANQIGFSDKLYILGQNLNAFGFYSQSQMWLRVGSGDTWLSFNLPSEIDINKFHIYKLIRTSNGFELIIDSVSIGTVEYLGINVFNIARLGSAVDYPMSIDVDYLNICSNGTKYEYNAFFANAGSVNVTPLKKYDIDEIMSNIQDIESRLEDITTSYNYVSYDAENKLFSIYMQISANTFIGLNVYKFSSRNKIEDEVVYQHLWRLDRGYLYKFIDGKMVQQDIPPLITAGESECVIQRTSSAIDFTGGYHGDETIDLDDSCFVNFYADGILLDTSESFILKPCKEASYIQKSYLHNTASYGYNVETIVSTVSETGVLSLTSDYNFAIDGIDTGIKAYKTDGIYKTIDAAIEGLNLTITKGDNGNWILSKVVQVDKEHTIIATHLKETIFKEQGYETTNTIIFNESAANNEYFWYHGICCLGKGAATIGHNEDYEDIVFSGTNQNYLGHKEYSLFAAYNPNTLLSARISSNINDSSLFADKECSMFIWDRSYDSKYYRKTPIFKPNVGERMVSEMSVSWNG